MTISAVKLTECKAYIFGLPVGIGANEKQVKYHRVGKVNFRFKGSKHTAALNSVLPSCISCKTQQVLVCIKLNISD